MYDLFDSSYLGNGKTFPIVKLRTNRAVIQRELGRVCSFYRGKPIDVDESHVISQLIKILHVSVRRDAEQTIQACVDRTPEVAKILGLIHPYNNKPIEHVGVFYNDHVRELILLDETATVNPETVKRVWPLLNSIQILTHPFNDINFHLCNGKYPASKSGYAVFSVNVPLLILQYQQWAIDQKKHGHAEIRVTRFVGQVVIPNMVGAHMNIAYINRAMDIYRGKMVPVMKRHHPVSVVDITQHVDETIESQIKILTDNVLDIHNFYSAFPAVSRATWRESITVPDIAPNQNVRWALSLSVLKYIDFMVEYFHVKDPARLRVISSRLIKDINRMNNNKEFKTLAVTAGGNLIANIQTNLH